MDSVPDLSTPRVYANRLLHRHAFRASKCGLGRCWSMTLGGNVRTRIVHESFRKGLNPTSQKTEQCASDSTTPETTQCPIDHDEVARRIGEVREVG